MSKKNSTPIIPEMKSVHPLQREFVNLVLIALSYWGVSSVGLLFSAPADLVFSVWTASGFTLAVLLLNPARRWRSIIVVVFLVNAAGNLGRGGGLGCEPGRGEVSLGQCVAGDEVGDVDDGDGHVFVEAIAVDEPGPAASSFALDWVIEGAALDQPQCGAQVVDAGASAASMRASSASAAALASTSRA